jgi:hypothetical protein
MLLLFWQGGVVLPGETALVAVAVPPAAMQGNAQINARPSFIDVAVAPAAFVAPGSAAILIAPPTLGGVGSVSVAATSAGVIIGPPTVAAVGVTAAVIAAGGVVIGPPALSSDGGVTSTAHVDVVMPPPVLDGAGAVQLYGLGGVTIPPPVLGGIGLVPIYGTGAVVVAKPVIAAVGQLQFIGTVQITISRPVVVVLVPPPPPGPPPPLPPSDVHIIECYTPQGVLLGRVQPIRRAKFTMVESDVGDFEIELPWIYDDVINIMQTRNRIEYAIQGTKVFGGIIMKRTFRQEGRYSMVTLSGPGYTGLLSGRIIVPPPGQADDVYTNVRADDLMKNIVRKHLGSLAPAARRALGFNVDVNLSQSSFITNYNGRYETVLDALKSIVKQATDTKFLVVRGPDGLLQFKTFVPIIGTDHSLGQADLVMFDMGGGNALNVEYVEDGTAVRNYIYGGGTGDDAARLMREGFNQESIDGWGRIEEFLDTNAATSPELDLEILKKLEEVSRGGPSLTFTIGQAGRYEYPADFAFGDKVSALWHEAGLTLTDVISAITLSLEENGSLGVEMSIGAPNLFRLSPGRALARFIKALRGEVGLMQRH